MRSLMPVVYYAVCIYTENGAQFIECENNDEGRETIKNHLFRPDVKELNLEPVRAFDYSGGAA